MRCVMRLGVGLRDARHIFDTDGLDPFGCDDVSLFHRHPGVFVKHLLASAAAPGEELQEVISTYGLCTGRCVGFGLTIGNTAVGILHGATLLSPISMPVGFLDFQAPLGHAIGDGFPSKVMDYL